MTLQFFESKYTPDEIVQLNRHFKKLVVGEDRVSYVDNKNDKHYPAMVELILKRVVGESASNNLFVTGSASQNLKCVSEDQQGDVDILFLSTFPKLTKADQERVLVPCDEPGYFKIKQLGKYPFVTQNGIRFLNADSLREFEPVWFAKELQLPLMLIESFDSEYARAAKGKVSSSLDWRTSHPELFAMNTDLLYRNNHYFQVFVRSYEENIIPILNEDVKKQANHVLSLLLRILSFSSRFSTGETTLAIQDLEKFGPEFENGIVPAFLMFLRERDKFADAFEIQEDAEFYTIAHKYFEEVAMKETACLTTPSSGEKRIRGSIDLVPGIQCEGFPLIANEWEKRVKGRPWPPAQLVTSVLSSGFHLVPKVSKKTGSDPSTSFSLGFGIAEKLLAQGLTQFQRECFRVFKMYFYEKLKWDSEVLSTYHLKTVLFWVLEKSDPSIWHEKNRAYCCILLLDYLKISVLKETLPHYFIPENNLFEYSNKSELKKVLETLEEVLADPVSATGKTMEQIRRFYANPDDRQSDDEDAHHIDKFFSKSSALFETTMEELKTSRLQDLGSNDDVQIGLLQVLTDEAKTKILKFCFDLVLARNFQAKTHRLFSRYAPLPSAIAMFIHKLLPVSSEFLGEVTLPQANRDVQKKYKAIENIIEIAKYLKYEDLLTFAMLKNGFYAKNNDSKFDVMANAILGMANSHDEL